MKEFDELWPLPYPPIVVATGPFGSGKSTFALGTGAAMKRTLGIDMELSLETFAQQLGFDYWNLSDAMLVKHPKSWAPLDVYQEIDAYLEAVPSDKYDVLILDNASPLEDGMSQMVDKFPAKFGLTQNQLERSSGLKWGAVKNLYQQKLSQWASKFKVIVITVQLRDKWAGNKVVLDEFGKPVQEPKGKETLEMLSSLFLWLQPGPGGIPSANVLKCRLDRKVYVEDPDNPPADVPEAHLKALRGEPGVVSIPVLPLRLPQCTWTAVREYMRHPANLAHPKEGEVPSKKELTDDDRLKLRSIIAQNEASTAEVEKARLQAEAEKKAVEDAKKALEAGKQRLVKELCESYKSAVEVAATLKNMKLEYTLEAHDAIKAKLIEAKNGRQAEPA